MSHGHHGSGLVLCCGASGNHKERSSRSCSAVRSSHSTVMHPLPLVKDFLLFFGLLTILWSDFSAGYLRRPLPSSGISIRSECAHDASGPLGRGRCGDFSVRLSGLSGVDCAFYVRPPEGIGNYGANSGRNSGPTPLGYPNFSRFLARKRAFFYKRSFRARSAR